MKLNPKVTGALAWTGLVLVLAVPAANMLIDQPEAKIALTSDTDQVKTSSTKPAQTAPAKPVAKPAAGDDVVEEFVKSGKKLPSYISGSDTPATDEASVPKTPIKKPGTITINPDGTIDKPAATTAPATDVATLPKTPVVAPVPLPASARPKVVAPVESPLILDEEQVAARDPNASPVIIPPEPIPEDTFVDGDQLEEWDSGSLADYLRRKGLMEDSAQTSDSFGQYDANGFFLSDGPNRPRSNVVIIGN